MGNKVHVEKFLKLLQKATLNHSIENVRMTFTKDIYKVGMKGANSLLILKGENDIITGIKSTDEWEMNFQDVQKNLKNYLSIIIPDEDGYANIIMSDSKLTVNSGNQNTRCFFCSDNIPATFTKDGPKSTGEQVVNFEIDDEFITAYNLIKKVAAQFKKVYFGVEDGKLFIEAGDRTNAHANNMTITLQDTDFDDMFVCFDYKGLMDVMTLINGDAYDFYFRIGYLPNRNSGLMSFTKGDDNNNETYYLLSLRENTQK
jgi:hypothetical protein